MKQAVIATMTSYQSMNEVRVPLALRMAEVLENRTYGAMRDFFHAPPPLVLRIDDAVAVIKKKAAGAGREGRNIYQG